MKKLLLLVAFVPLIAHAQIITTIAGTGLAGYSGDGGAANIATLHGPTSVVADAAGNIYIAEEANHTVRKIATSGVITTFAGTGTGGYSGDGGAATAAQLNSPTCVTIDRSGNVYIADFFNNRIRKVSTFGIITTFAGTGTSGFSGDGGAATAAQLSRPQGLCVDTADNIYLSDSYTSVVRKVSPSGIITSIAGTGANGYNGDGISATAAKLYNPFGLWADKLGNLYIADQNNHRIRKVDALGTITTVAGNGSAGSTGDGSAATLAKLNTPFGVFADSVGNIFVADQWNAVIRKVSSSGTITRFAGTGSAGYSGDGGPATAASLNYPSNLFMKSSGDFLIADHNNNRIRKVHTPNTGIHTLLQKQFNLYPNPTKGDLTIVGTERMSRVFITNMTGQVVYDHRFDATRVQISVADLPAGVYQVKIDDTVLRFEKE